VNANPDFQGSGRFFYDIVPIFSIIDNIVLGGKTLPVKLPLFVVISGAGKYFVTPGSQCCGTGTVETVTF
jgi:hypothetical protein